MDDAYLEIQKAEIVKIQIEVVSMQTVNMGCAFKGIPPVYTQGDFDKKVQDVQGVIDTIWKAR